MDELGFQAIKSAGFVAAVVLVVGLQRIAPHSRVRGSRGVNFGLWGVNLVVMGTVCGACACVASIWATRHELGVLNAVGAPGWLAVLATVVGLDFVSYCWHRLNHVVPLLWRFHQVHHADGLFSASTGVRFHPGELLLSLPLRLAAVVILGAPVLGVIVFEVIFGFANLLVHGDIDLPRGLERIVEKFFVTPALHRRHHGRAAGQLGTNFGTIFSVWDRLLRSFGENRSAAKIEVGIAAVPQSLSLGGVLRLPFSPSRVPVAT